MSSVREHRTARLIDYVLTVGLGDGFLTSCDSAESTEVTLEGIDDLLQRRFPGEILSRAPMAMHSDFELPSMVPLFVFPDGVPILTQRPRQHMHAFVLTKMNGTRCYGFCAIKYTKLSDRKFAVLQKMTKDTEKLEELRGKLHTATSICIISQYPYLRSFFRFFAALCRILPMRQKFGSSIIHRAFSLLSVHGFPKEGGCSVTLGKTQIDFPFESDTTKLPMCSINFGWVLRCLDPERIVEVFVSLLLERQIVFVSSHYFRLTTCTEALLALLYPFEWPHVYVPMLPRALLDFLNAPLPFVLGIHRDCLQIKTPPKECVIVDLDNNTVLQPTEMKDKQPAFPSKYRRYLIKALAKYDEYGSREPVEASLPVTADSYCAFQGASAGVGGSADSSTNDDAAFASSLSSCSASPLDGGPLRHASSSSSSLSGGLLRGVDSGGASGSPALSPMAGAAGFTPTSPILSSPSVAARGSPTVPSGPTFLPLRHSFIRFFVDCLKMYRQYLVIPTAEDPNPKMLFKTELFKQEFRESYGPFIVAFTESQTFSWFAQERLLNVDKDYFDLMVAEKLEKYALKLSLQANTTKGGKVFKMGKIVKNWKTRWFNVSDLELVYYVDNTKEVVKGKLQLVPGETRVEVPLPLKVQPTPYLFSIVTKQRTLFCCTENGEERHQWVQLLRAKIMDVNHREEIIKQFMPMVPIETPLFQVREEPFIEQAMLFNRFMQDLHTGRTSEDGKSSAASGPSGVARDAAETGKAALPEGDEGGVESLCVSAGLGGGGEGEDRECDDYLSSSEEEEEDSTPIPKDDPVRSVEEEDMT